MPQQVGTKNMRKILITGATGKIGMRFISHLAGALTPWHIVIDTRNPTGDKVQLIRHMCPHPVEAITGRKPNSFYQFLLENQAWF